LAELESVRVSIPDWVASEKAGVRQPLPKASERLDLVLKVARENFERGTGGPFAAAVFRSDTWELVALGVNRVVVDRCSSAHAEIVALSLAQQTYGSYDLGGPGMPPHELVVSWRPCAMCFGALPWSGIRSLLIAGSGEIEAITGFDEGPIHPDWQKELERRGIQVAHGDDGERALAVLRDFASAGGMAYNGRLG
jgi:tRNA(Arg) A34 adenosine deaminase TadA